MSSAINIVSKKRDRPTHLSLHVPTVIIGEPVELSSVQQRTHKRSRLIPPLVGSLLPSPSTGIAKLVLSSPSAEVVPLPSSLTQSPPRSKRRFSLCIDGNNDADRLGVNGGSRAWELIQSSTRLDILQSSDVDDDVIDDVIDDDAISQTSSCKSASNPSIRTVSCTGGVVDRGPVLAACVSWQNLSEAATCRHQESSCNSSLSSSSNNGHTPSFPIS